MNWIDIVIIAIVILGSLIGIWKGFFKSILSLISIFVVFICSFLLCKPTAELIIKSTTWDNKLNTEISSWLINISPKFDEDMIEMDEEKLSNHINNTLSIDGFPKVLKIIFKSTTSLKPEDIEHKTTFTMNNLISQTLTLLTFIVSLFILYVILFLLLKLILNKITKKLTDKSSTIKVVDKTMGGIFGIARGLLWVVIIFMFLSIFRSSLWFTEINNIINKSLFGSKIANWSYELVDKFFNLKTMLKFLSNSI